LIDATTNVTQPQRPLIDSLPHVTANNTWEIDVDHVIGSDGNDIVATYGFFGAEFDAFGALIVTDGAYCSTTKKPISLSYTASWMNPSTFVNATFIGVVTRVLAQCYTAYDVAVSPGTVAYELVFF
jgi:hypothetical protein